MGVLDRFGDIMKSNINAVLDKMEDPSKMVDQYLLNYRKELANVKNETSAVMANERSCYQQVVALKEEILKDGDRRDKAVAAGADDDVAAFDKRMSDSIQLLDEAQAVYDAAKVNADHMKQLHDKLVSDIDALERRKNLIKSKASIAKATEAINRTGNISSGDAASKMSAMERRVDEKLNKAQAMSELNAPSATDDLAKRYDAAPTSSIEDRLAELRGEKK